MLAGVLNDQEREMMDVPVAIKTIKSEGEMCKTLSLLVKGGGGGGAQIRILSQLAAPGKFFGSSW